MQGIRSKRDIFLLSLVALSLVWLQLRLLEYGEDDAFIHFRIAKNWIKSGLPYFNGGEAVFVSSAFGWTALVALVFKLFAPGQLPVALLNAGITFFAATVWGRLLGRLLNNRSAYFFWLGFSLTFCLLLESSIGLMETPLALLVLGLAFSTTNFLIAGVLFGVAIFLRLELSVFTLLFIFIARHRGHLIRFLAGIIVVVLPVGGYLLYVYGTVIPQAVIAKPLLYQVSWINTFVYILIAVLSERLLAIWPLGFAMIATLLMVGVLGTFFICMCQKESALISKAKNIFLSPFGARVPTVLFFGSVVIILTYLTKGVLVHSWYYPVFTVPLLFSMLYFGISSRSKLWSTLIFICLLAPLSAGVLNMTAGIWPILYSGIERGARVRQYLEIGRQLNSRYPNLELMTSEIGALSFSFNGKVVDAAAIATPKALRYHPLAIPSERASGSIGAIPLKLIEDELPGLIVTYDIFVPAFLSSKVRSQYQEIKYPVYLPEDRQIGVPNFLQSSGLYVFIRRDAREVEEID